MWLARCGAGAARWFALESGAETSWAQSSPVAAAVTYPLPLVLSALSQPQDSESEAGPPPAGLPSSAAQAVPGAQCPPSAQASPKFVGRGPPPPPAPSLTCRFYHRIGSCPYSLFPPKGFAVSLAPSVYVPPPAAAPPLPSISQSFPFPAASLQVWRMQVGAGLGLRRVRTRQPFHPCALRQCAPQPAAGAAAAGGPHPTLAHVSSPLPSPHLVSRQNESPQRIIASFLPSSIA